MAYSSIYGNRPPEFASKSAHSQIINDPTVNEYLAKCQLPLDSQNIHQDDLTSQIFNFQPIKNSIQHVLAVDCGYHTSVTRKGFPSSKIALFNFGASFLSLSQLNDISSQPFISPKAMCKLRQDKSWQLVLPISGMTYKHEQSLSDSVRVSLNEFFNQQLNTDNTDTLLGTLKWLLYQEYNQPLERIELANCPNLNCPAKKITLHRQKDDHKCPQCSKPLFLIDYLQLRELVDEDQGVSGSLPIHIITIVEHLLITHYIRFFIRRNPDILREILFLKDGPLAFFGFRQSAFLHKYMRNMLNHLQARYTISLAGLEKSGNFVEHAVEICNQSQQRLATGQFLLLNNDYIYKYIVPGKPDKGPYGYSTHYGLKMIFHDTNGKVHVITIPVANDKVVINPKPSNIKNLDMILTTIDKLKCDMYDNALLPITLINKAVSLANRPSATILRKFTRYKVIK